MRLIRETKDGEIINEQIDTGEKEGTEMSPIYIENADGYAACDVYIEAGYMTWEQLGVLKEAITLAEKMWRQ